MTSANRVIAGPRPAPRAVLLWLAATALALTGLRAEAAGGDSLRPEVGKPLQAATAMLREKRFKEADEELRKAEAVENKSPYEASVIEQMHAAIASAAGDLPAAIAAYKTLILSDQVDAAERIKMLEALAVDCYQLKDYAGAIAWSGRYFKDGGTDPALRTVLVQSYYLSGDLADAVEQQQGLIGEEEQAGKTPPETQFQLLANCYFLQKDEAGYTHAMERLVALYPKKQYWTDLIHHVFGRPGFAADRLALDVERLRLATGTITKADQFMEMTELALEAGLPAEAQQTLDKGFAAGVLGLGPDAPRHQRLKDLAARTVADDRQKLSVLVAQAQSSGDGIAIFNTGYSEVSFGAHDQGIALMQEGLRKGGLKHLEDAKLHLALAYLVAGMTPQAIQELKTVRGDDGTAELARLWLLHLNEGSTPAK